ncbi:B12-binding domain-containing radical SAM protein [Methanobacterium spitsbergense]|uniref:B12-binding domain-containing radical SAM protein n=1 Tax=Methanobacterium spitsbergense TaxID=2874285 RepID=A0A8T5USI0_9EURY|nr:radical SAM protein [Methanobacterium spitsbergense]MBZ2166728.1 B12-binding domain-containing radical SAM protein [Methanobacterium spitsbergense]
MKILFVEPPKDLWFVMGEYTPPPLGILQLASFIESRMPEIDIEVLDCQAESVGWNKLAKRIENFEPDIVVSSALATCNTYTVLRALDTVKKIDPNIKTVVGGQHFTALAQESLEDYSEIDFIIRGEGELTLLDLVQTLEHEKTPLKVRGISFRHDGKVIHNPERPLIDNLDDLPFPGYHFVEDHIDKYHFKMMAGPNAGYAMVEASRGCVHKCTFCSQWPFWGGKWRSKSPERIADEMAHIYNEYDISFLWLTDDNLGLGKKTSEICDELIKKDVTDDLTWFFQARSDDIIKNAKILPKLRKAGNYWIMAGLERHDDNTLNKYQKGIKPSNSKLSMDLLKENGIFSQATMIMGDRKDSHSSMQDFREYVNYVDPDLAVFMVLTPFPGTDLYKTARENGWLQEDNWANYDMIHAVMPTEHLTISEVQEELFKCYRDFYGSMKRRITGIFSKNMFKRKTYRYMASQGLLEYMRDLVDLQP